MRKRFVIILYTPEKRDEKGVCDALVDRGYAYWHWNETVWCIRSHSKTSQDTAEAIAAVLHEFMPVTEFLVLEIQGAEPWSGRVRLDAEGNSKLSWFNAWNKP